MLAMLTLRDRLIEIKLTSYMSPTYRHDSYHWRPRSEISTDLSSYTEISAWTKAWRATVVKFQKLVQLAELYLHGEILYNHEKERAVFTCGLYI